MKKTSPKKLHPMAQNDRQTDKHTHGHGDSMTDPAQRAESVKITLKKIRPGPKLKRPTHLSKQCVMIFVFSFRIIGRDRAVAVPLRSLVIKTLAIRNF